MNWGAGKFKKGNFIIHSLTGLHVGLTWVSGSVVDRVRLKGVGLFMDLGFGRFRFSIRWIKGLVDWIELIIKGVLRIRFWF